MAEPTCEFCEEPIRWEVSKLRYLIKMHGNRWVDGMRHESHLVCDLHIVTGMDLTVGGVTEFYIEEYRTEKGSNEGGTET